MRKITNLLIISIILFSACKQQPIKVACIGDSITEGDGLSFQSRSSYPVVLDNLLPEQYKVLNCGRSSTTMLRNGNFPYWTSKDLHNVFVYKPDIIIIKLGTNDTKPINWNARDFESDYEALIDTLQSMPTDPALFLCLPVPVYQTRWGINDSTIVAGVIPAIKRMASKYRLPVIDLYGALSNQPQHFPDGVHPNAAGAENIAREVMKYLIPQKNN